MASESRIRTTLGPFTLENPFILASGPPTATADQIRHAFDAGWAGAVIKTIRPDEMVITDVSPRFSAWKDRDSTLLGFENIELLSKKSVSYWLIEISKLRREFPDKLLIASIMAGADPAEWQDLALKIQSAGAHAIELNFSCPHGMPERGLGAAIGQQADLVRELTTHVKKITTIPLIVKLTPNVTDIIPIAQAAIKGGTDMISAINTIQCLIGIDLDTFFPIPSVGGYSTYGGYSGPAVKPVGLRVVSQIAQAGSTPVIGIGGISSWNDATEYILAGASAVQVCSAVMWRGYGIIRELTTGLSEYLEEKGLSGPDVIRGKALSQITSHETLNRNIRGVPFVNQDTCTKCGTCVISCRDGGYQAIRMTNKGVAIDQERCDNCSLCSLVCPSKSITMISIRMDRQGAKS
ncbi:NAD-dependent dihydropyrimidine dehydrogenase subunit PreA [Methanospirillum stamsii]|uniref:Dihydroorotate dehydrogenase B (NAD(+)), catalytic subunit n=1 Tax=Methanospirillum stamsii TaxID=1277351 RepID=A0A2V2MZ38_9EURY|nr:NAD-dependent dihydropyrimidine dehydrogenase subunit PreA [Methanospirillum stamsii]PWR73404.1 NAD-dependent dihydropyrimidine dehydrogenase subunit PreA [Methanospirillum stamsii]